jgi:hypothetical protein
MKKELSHSLTTSTSSFTTTGEILSVDRNLHVLGFSDDISQQSVHEQGSSQEEDRDLHPGPELGHITARHALTRRKSLVGSGETTLRIRNTTTIDIHDDHCQSTGHLLYREKESEREFRLVIGRKRIRKEKENNYSPERPGRSDRRVVGFHDESKEFFLGSSSPLPPLNEKKKEKENYHHCHYRYHSLPQ